MDTVKNFFIELWTTLKDYYKSYSLFIHSFLPNEAGTFAEILIDAIVIIIIVKILNDTAFKRD
jgi:hypothetical protein